MLFAKSKNTDEWLLLLEKGSRNICRMLFFSSLHRLCVNLLQTVCKTNCQERSNGDKFSRCALPDWSALQRSQCKHSPFLCDRHDMGQNTRCSVVECREFNEQRLILTHSLYIYMYMCVCTVSLHSCQAHWGGAGTQECSSTYVYVKVFPSARHKRARPPLRTPRIQRINALQVRGHCDHCAVTHYRTITDAYRRSGGDSLCSQMIESADNASRSLHRCSPFITVQY